VGELSGWENGDTGTLAFLLKPQTSPPRASSPLPPPPPDSSAVRWFRANAGNRRETGSH
jgi:hypothetical protein